MRVIALLCFALLCGAHTPAQAQFRFGGTFDGGNISCTTHDLQSMTRSDPRVNKTNAGNNVVGSVDVVDKEGRSLRYVWTVTTRDTGRRRLSLKNGVMEQKVWNFVCNITPKSSLGHTCPTHIKSPTGSCIVCDKSSCKRVTYSVRRTEQKQ